MHRLNHLLSALDARIQIKTFPRPFPVVKNWEVRTTGAGNEYLQYTLENITYHKQIYTN